jgi:hypothetical protein
MSARIELFYLLLLGPLVASVYIGYIRHSTMTRTPCGSRSWQSFASVVTMLITVYLTIKDLRTNGHRSHHRYRFS